MNLLNLFKPKRKLELEIISKGDNLVEVKRYHDGIETKSPVQVYVFSKEFVEAVNSYQ